MSGSLNRRGFLLGALAVAAVTPLAACAGGGGTTTSATPSTGATSATNPFGAVDGTYTAHIFNGGYGVAYAEFAAKQVTAKIPGVMINVQKGQQIAQELQPSFASGENLPAVIDNSGKGKIGLATIINEVEDLTEVINSNNYEGTPIKDTLYAGVLDDGTVNGKLAEIKYVMTVYSLWYSASLFEANNWAPPTTWDEAIELGAKAKAKGKYLFLWGNEAADYYQEMIITSATKEGGPQVRMDLDNLKEGAWSNPAIIASLEKLKEIIDLNYMKPGGSGTKFTAAQAQWSNKQDALLYPSGAWIENEMASQTKEGFQMTGTPVPTVSAAPKLPFASLHASADEAYIVPTKGAPAVGKEFMRAMLSKDAAANFAQQIKSPTIVKDTVPEDGFGSTGLASQMYMLSAAGDNVFGWKFHNYYGMGAEHVTLWNSFLDKKLTVDQLVEKLQAVSDAVANDSSIEKYTVSK